MTNTTTIFGIAPSPTIKDEIINLSDRNPVKGVRFPLYDPNNSGAGIFGQSTGVARLEGQVVQLLGTGGDERLMLPNFGLSLEEYLFEPMDAETMINIKKRIVTALSEYIPDAQILSLRIVPLDDIGGYGIPGFKTELKLFSLDFQAGTDVTVYHRP